MLRRISLLFLATSLALWAQADGGASIAIFPPPLVAFAELRQHLGLSDGQLESLLQILREKSEANQEAYRQIEQKRAELQNLLESGSRDVSRIGQLTLDIHTLSKQPPPSGDWRQRALAVLTPEQRAKLGPLDQAMKLSAPAYQAVTLDLIDPAPPAPPRILPAADTRPLPALPAPGTPVPLPMPLLQTAP